MNNFSDMLSKAKAMQEKMKEAQDQIKKIEVEGEAGGNLVKVVSSGDSEIKSITISDAAKKESQDIINDLIIAAQRGALNDLHRSIHIICVEVDHLRLSDFADLVNLKFSL